VHGGLEVDEGGPGLEGPLQLVEADTVAVDGDADQTGAGLGEGGHGPGVGGVLHHHGVARSQPAGGGGADALLGAGGDEDLTGTLGRPQSVR